MSDRPVLILFDSRGRLLDNELNTCCADFNFYHHWQNGLRLENTFEVARPLILDLKPKLVYYLNGICDITQIKTRNPWSVGMRNISPHISTENFMMKVDQLYANTFALSEFIDHFIMVIFSSQTGLDIGKCNGYPTELISPEQKPLYKTIMLINKRISDLNKSVSIVTPFLSSAVHQRCRGKYRFTSDKLVDGCHPTPALAKCWATKLKANIITNFSKYDRYALSNQMYRYLMLAFA